jgi:hypothetical protein
VSALTDPFCVRYLVPVGGSNPAFGRRLVLCGKVNPLAHEALDRWLPFWPPDRGTLGPFSGLLSLCLPSLLLVVGCCPVPLATTVPDLYWP